MWMSASLARRVEETDTASAAAANFTELRDSIGFGGRLTKVNLIGSETVPMRYLCPARWAPARIIWSGSAQKSIADRAVGLSETFWAG